jgi:hypothetical protein
MLRLKALFPVLMAVLVAGFAPGDEAIPNWPAPPYWTRPAVRAPGQARIQAVTASSAPLPFVAIDPCRMLDTRITGGPIASGTSRTVMLTGAPCGIPSSAAAVSANFVVFDILGTLTNGVLVIYPAGSPGTSQALVNWSPSSGQIDNASAVPLGTAGAITVQPNQGAGSIDLVIDVNGYYDGSGTLQLSLTRRAALDQFWTSQNAEAVGLTTVGATPLLLKSDGADIWVANFLGGGTVSRVRASDGKSLESWTGALNAFGVVVAMGRVIVTGSRNPGNLYLIDPSQVAGAVTTVASNLGNGPHGITFDGARVWTANASGSVSIITPGATIPWTVTTVTAGLSSPNGALYDGANVWVTDINTGTLLRLDSSGVIITTVAVGVQPQFPVFDGTNIWVPNNISNSISVVRALDGAVVQTLTGNGLNGPVQAAFDGQRVLVTNNNGATATVSLWRAADLAPLGSFTVSPGNVPFGACSDGVNFWITQPSAGKLMRF